MRPILFRCPTTGKMVQRLMADKPLADDERHYEMTQCPACHALHLINQATGMPSERIKVT